MTVPSSLGTRFDPRSNCVGALRLLFALTVVATHAGPVSGTFGEVGRGDNNLGTLAVEGFFVLSGLLVTRSALNSRSLSQFMLRRMTRILPGFWAALIVTAFVFAALAGHPDFGSQIGYARHNWWLPVHQDGILGTLGHVPYPNNWNVSLWTLKWEFGCYAAVGLLLSLRALRPPMVLLVTVLAWSWLNGVPHADDRPARFFLVFMVGSSMWLFREYLPLTRSIVGSLALLALGTYLFGGFLSVGLIAFGYVIVAVATRRVLPRVGARTDLSYGVYLYGWPIGQLLASRGLHSPVLFVLIEVTLALSLAWVSWTTIEGPCQRWSQRVIRDGDGRAEVAPLTARDLSQGSTA